MIQPDSNSNEEVIPMAYRIEYDQDGKLLISGL